MTAVQLPRANTGTDSFAAALNLKERVDAYAADAGGIYSPNKPRRPLRA